MIHWKQAAHGRESVQLDLPRSLARRVLADVAHLDARLGEAAHLSFPTAATEAVREALRRHTGRDGVDAGEYVDARVTLDHLTPPDALELVWAGRTVAWADNHTWMHTRVGLGVEFPGAASPARSVVSFTDGSGETGRRMTWDPGTVAVLRDVARASLPVDQPDTYTVVRSNVDDRFDALRRAAHAAFGVPYHGDIPPFPADAVLVRRPSRFGLRAAIVDKVRVDLPGELDSAGADVHVDTDTGLVHVQRHAGSYYSGFAVPLTERRRQLITELNSTFDTATESYAAAGCGPDAAAALAEAGVSAFRVYELLDILLIRDQADAAAFLAADEDGWRARGWSINPFGGPLSPGFSGFRQFGAHDFGRCWSAADAATLADNGITADEAYRARKAGLDTVDRLLAEHAAPIGPGALQRAARWRLVARTAADLLARSTTALDADLEARLASATTHTTVELSDDSDGDTSGAGVRVERHDFTGADGSTVSLWQVSDYTWWAGEEDADVDETMTVWTSGPDALAHARSVRTRQLVGGRHGSVLRDEDYAGRLCPPGGVAHCDHCAQALPPGQGMIASLGRACGVECYDAMADTTGAHAGRHHR